VAQSQPSIVADDGSRSEPVVVGKISAVFGVRGWVKVYSYTSPPENILDYRPWYLLRDGRWRPSALADGKPHGKGLTARLEGCADRDHAAALVGAEIAVRRDQLPEPEQGEYYWTDLEGLRVETVAGVDLGRLDRLFETGANDVMVVLGERERLIPYLWGSVVRSVDLDAGLMVVDWDPEF
jgi:16S rRNA processing protein RimM